VFTARYGLSIYAQVDFVLKGSGSVIYPLLISFVSFCGLFYDTVTDWDSFPPVVKCRVELPNTLTEFNTIYDTNGC
jgi:hypothetical protein